MHLEIGRARRCRKWVGVFNKAQYWWCLCTWWDFKLEKCSVFLIWVQMQTEMCLFLYQECQHQYHWTHSAGAFCFPFGARWQGDFCDDDGESFGPAHLRCPKVTGDLENIFYPADCPTVWSERLLHTRNERRIGVTLSGNVDYLQTLWPKTWQVWNWSNISFTGDFVIYNRNDSSSMQNSRSMYPFQRKSKRNGVQGLRI